MFWQRPRTTTKTTASLFDGHCGAQDVEKFSLVFEVPWNFHRANRQLNYRQETEAAQRQQDYAWWLCRRAELLYCTVPARFR